MHLHGTEQGIKALVQATYPSYRGRKFTFQTGEEVSLTGGYWDGGTRSEYVAVDLSTLRTSAAGDLYHASAKGAPTVSLEPGIAIVEHSIFCGQDMGLTFHIHPNDSPQLIPPVDTVTDHEKIVLEFTGSLKNTYGGRTNIRFTEAAHRYEISQEEWTAAQESLKTSKHLNKAGSITVTGRNVDTAPFRS